MLLSDRDIIDLIYSKRLAIEPFDIDRVGPSSVDLHLSAELLKYDCSIIHLGQTRPSVTTITIDNEKGYKIKPGEFLLGRTREKVCIPLDLQGTIETKGDIARAGLQVHNCDGHIDPGYSGTITLELVNNNHIPIVLYPGVLICQIFFSKLSSSCRRPYNGKYSGQTTPTAYIPANLKED